MREQPAISGTIIFHDSEDRPMTKKTHAVVISAALLAAVACWTGCSKKQPSAAPAVGYGTISGIVTNVTDSTAIYGVAISTVPATSVVATNADGRYTIYNVQAGSYSVTASKYGYLSRTASISVTADNTTNTNFSLAAGGTIAIAMDTIPAGGFTMGSLPGDPNAQVDEQPQHAVLLDAYQISVYEITNAQYQAFIDAGGYAISAYWTAAGWTWRTNNKITEPLDWYSGQYNSGASFPNHPVNGVSWYEADAFCNWAGGKLPTEAQWEKAARGAVPANYWPWGSISDASKCNSFGNAAPDTFTYSSPAGSFNAGQSPYGVFDMAGNVWEWCNDWYGGTYYSDSSAASNPAGPATGTVRVLRGGSFYNYVSYCRTATRSLATPTTRDFNNGIRLVRQ
jgi:formylglycine-generating enzyme required for sulfatase activity